MRRFLAGVLGLMIVATMVHGDSVVEVKDGRASVKPAAVIDARSLTDSSGLAFWRGAWWSHNDRGGAPVLYRADAPDFKDARIMEVPGATNVDWEELAVFGDDLMVCDIGDNRRQRDDLKLYRLRWNAEKALIETVATYPVAYPDGKHDAAGAFTLDGKLHVVTKNRPGGTTGVYRFNQLTDGEINVAEKRGTLDIDERVRISAGDTDGENVVLLSYTHLFVYSADDPTGKPKRALHLHAGRCEAVALHQGELVYGNVDGEIYRVTDFFNRGIDALLPPPVSLELPFEASTYEPDGSGVDWKPRAEELKLNHMREGEYLRWMIGGGYLMLAGKFEYGSFASSRAAGNRLGSGMLLMFSREGGDFAKDGDVHLWLGDNGATGIDAWRMDPAEVALDPMRHFKAEGKVEGGTWYFEYALPLTGIFGEGKIPDGFQFNAWGYNLHGEDEPHLAGKTFFCFQNPYTWAGVTVRYPEDG